MINISRRRLADYAADQLTAGQAPRNIARQVAAVLLAAGKTKDTGLLIEDIAWQLENRGQLANVQVTSATELSESLRQEIASFIKQAAKVNKVTLNENINESVIGGVRIETAARTWDETIAKQLTEIRESF
jgi:F0F1-type ATP synthase delta subunit